MLQNTITHFKQDARVSSMRAFRQLAFESENATRRVAKVYTWKRQSLHVEIPNSTRGIFNVYWLSLVLRSEISVYRIQLAGNQ